MHLRIGAATALAAAVAFVAAPLGDTAHGDVEVRDAQGLALVSCPDIDSTKAAAPCLTTVEGIGIDVAIRSLVGTISISSCEIAFAFQVDASGETLIDRISIRGRSPCPDMAPCTRGRENAGWWRGQIRVRDGGGLVNEVDICLDTCFGRFEGPLTLDLERADRTWRAHAREAQVGESGLVIRGTLEIDSDQLDIRTVRE